MIEKSVRGSSVESTTKSYSHKKDGISAFKALVSNNAGETKYHGIMKKRMNMMKNIKWNGRAYPLDTHIINQRQEFDDLLEFSKHITVPVTDQPQRVEYPIDSLACGDNMLQSAIGLERANTNEMRQKFEAAATALIDVDPYQRSCRAPGTRGANVLTAKGIDFKAGRGSTRVDLRWHPKNYFRKFPDDHKDKLMIWFKTDEGKRARKTSDKKSNSNGYDLNTNNKHGGRGDGNWKEKFKKAINSPQGLKSVMSVIAEEEKINTSLVASLKASSALIPNYSAADTVGSISAAVPSNNLKLQSIFK